MQLYKKNKNFILLLSLSLSVGASGCTLQRMVRTAQKEQVITVNPNPLVANGQLINFELKAQVPEKLVRDKQTYKLDIYYEYGLKREDLATYSFKFGEFLYEGGTPTVVRSLSFPYAPAKNPGRLMVQGRAMDNKKGDVRYTEARQVATGLVTTPLLLVRNNEFSFISDSFKEAVNQPGTVVFYFGKDKSTLQTSQGPEEDALQQYVLDNVSTQQITITASQSPDETGTTLAQKRAKALEEYYRKKLKTLDYSGKKVDIQTKVAPLSLDLLTAKLKTAPINYQEKQAALDVLASSRTEQEKLQALQQLPVFTYVKEYIYPSLRSAQLEVDYNRSRKSDYELFILAKKVATDKTTPDQLSEDELQYAATLTPLLAEKRRLYEAAVKTTDKWPAYYNLGVVYNEMARKEYRKEAKLALLNSAVQNLTYAGFRNPSAQTYYSLASAYHQLGNVTEALKNYEYAIRLGGDEQLLQQVFADKAAMEIEAGQFDAAVTSLTYAGDSYQTNMNLGLSYLLKENYEGAEGYYQKALAKKPNDALAYYSLAVIGARTKNEQQLEQNLRRAVNTDRSFIEKAINDLEFEAYRDKAPYKDALLRH